MLPDEQPQENQKLLEQINAAYADGPDPDEQELLRRIRQTFRRLHIKEEWEDTPS